MQKEDDTNIHHTLWRMADKVPWSGVALMVGEAVYGWWRSRFAAGIVETLRDASTLALLDAAGRYLQNDLTAFQDWI